MANIVSKGLQDQGQKVINSKEVDELKFLESNKHLIMNLLQKIKSKKNY